MMERVLLLTGLGQDQKDNKVGGKKGEQLMPKIYFYSYISEGPL